MRYLPLVIMILFVVLSLYMPATPLVAGEITLRARVEDISEYSILVKDLENGETYSVWRDESVDIRFGDECWMTLALKTINGRRFDGHFDEHSYLISQGVSGKGKILSYELIVRREGARSFLAIDKVSGRVKGLYYAMVLGDKSYLQDEDKAVFRALGLRHILAISGMHLLILYGLLIRLPYLRRKRWLLLLLIMCYLYQINWPASALRAFLMLLYREACHRLKRPCHQRFAVAIATLVVIVIFPHRIFSIGFQFSTLAVFGVYLFHTGSSSSPLWRSVKVVLGIHVMLLPWQAFYFHEVSLVGWFLALTIGIIFDLVIKGLFILPVLAFLPAFVFSHMIALANTVIDQLFGVLQYVSFFAEKAIVPLVLRSSTLLVCLAILGILVTELREKWVKAVSCILVLLLLMTITIELYIMPLTVHYVNVGQGDGIILMTPHKSVVVVDTGYSGREIESVLKANGISNIDALFISHHHRDHDGGLLLLNEVFSIERIYANNLGLREGVFMREAKEGLQLEVDGLELTCIHSNKRARGENNRSLVLGVRYGGRHLLLTGDLEHEEEETLILGHSDVLKVAHHGSKTSTSEEFLQTVMPKYAIISVGDNEYGHPSDQVIQRLENLGVVVYRTDKEGTITLKIPMKE